jgi:hypothetical protein
MVVMKHHDWDLRFRRPNTSGLHLHQLSGPDVFGPDKFEKSNTPVGLIEIMDRKGSIHSGKKEKGGTLVH